MKKQYFSSKNCKKDLKLEEILFNNNEINDEINDNNFDKIFINFIFANLLFIEYKFELCSNNNLDIFEKINNLKNSINIYLEKKNTNINSFLNYFSEEFIGFLLEYDYILKKETLYNFVKEIKNRQFENEKFKKIEANILTKIVINYEEKKIDDSGIIDKNLKYLLTATKYPNIKELKEAIELKKKKHLPILKAYVFDENDEIKNNINKLQKIEQINNFINSFSEENKNMISRQNIEEDTIEKYLENNRKNKSENTSLDSKFEEFCSAYREITNVRPYIISVDSTVNNILNDDKKETTIFKLYKHLIEIQNHFLNGMIKEFSKNENENKDVIVSNAIEQIKKEIPIQNATKADIFEFNCKNNIILSFEELYSFYSTKDIFDKKCNETKKIDYSNYSNIKFKLSNIEKELINIILTGKKLFSNKQITYQFYLDPYKVEEKSIQFEKFTDNYGKEDLKDNEKENIFASIENLKKIILPNLEILINYLVGQNNYNGNQFINDINFHSNLYLNQDFLQFLKNFPFITINKLVSIYEFLEEKLWENIADRYVNKCFRCTGELEKYKNEINLFIIQLFQINTEELKMKVKGN